MLEQKLHKYLMEALGVELSLHRVCNDALSGLPIYLTQLYDFFEVRLLGKALIFAIERQTENLFTPLELARHVELLQRGRKELVALVLNEIRSYERSRLVRQGVPFVVPGTQMFLPQLCIDMREYFPRGRGGTSDTLSAATQLILLYHLECEPLDAASFRDVGSLTGYSAMTVSKAARELAGNGLCEIKEAGRALHLAFSACGEALWKEALPILRNPVLERYPISGPEPVKLPFAGITVLSQMTDLADDRLNTYAMSRTLFRREKQNGDLLISRTRDGATASLEVWAYDPTVICTGNRIDPLSLYLSLNTSPDERIQAALAKILEEIKW